jgi:hypothetical protein
MQIGLRIGEESRELVSSLAAEITSSPEPEA